MTMPLLVVGNRNYSTWSLRAWLGLRLAGIPFEVEVIPMGQPDSQARMLARGPTGAVPVLVVEGQPIWDSLAICEYAAEVATGPSPWPEERLARALARSLCAEMHDGYRGLRWHWPMNLRRPVGPTPLEAEPARSVEAETARVAERWRLCRERFGSSGPYLFGRFTLADAFYAPLATRLDTYAAPLAPDTRAYVDAVLDHPLVREWRAEARAEPWIIPHSDR